MEQDTVSDSDTYRVVLHDDDTYYQRCISQLHSDRVDGVEKHIKYMPEWMKNKIAVLKLTPYEATESFKVEGIGRRVDKNIYWVEDTRSQAEVAHGVDA